MKGLGAGFCRSATVVVALVLVNASMLVAVVLQGLSMPSHSYPFTLFLALAGTLVYYIAARIDVISGSAKSLANVWSFKYGGILGLLWSFNFSFLLYANSRTPGVIQVVLNEANIAVVMVASKFYLKSSYGIRQVFAALLIVSGGLLPLYRSTELNGLQTIWWTFTYLIGACAIPIANTYLEKCVKETTDGAPTFNIFELLMAQNGWMFLFCVPWFWLYILPGDFGYMHPNEFFPSFINGLGCIFGVQTQSDDTCSLAPIYAWATLFLSVAATYLQGFYERIESATYTTLVLSVSPYLAAIFFSLPSFMGRWYDPTLGADWTTWVGLGLSLLGVIYYKADFLDSYFNRNRRGTSDAEKPLMGENGFMNNYGTTQTSRIA